MKARTLVPPLKRVLAILWGCFYLLGFSFVLSMVAEADPLLCQAVTFVAAIVIMVVLTVFGERSLSQGAAGFRFSISTLMLIVVPLSIYLAAARVFVLALFRNPLVGVGTWIMFGVFAIVVMFVTTVILLLMAEAVLWYLVRVQRMCRKNAGHQGAGD